MFKWFYDLKTGVKLIGGFVIIAALLGIVAFMGYSDLKSVNDGLTSMYADHLLPTEHLGNAASALFQVRGDVYRFVFFIEERTPAEKAVGDGIAEVKKQMSSYRETALGEAEKAALAKFDPAFVAYQTAVADIQTQVKAGNQQAVVTSLLPGGAAYNARTALSADLDTLIALNVKSGDELNAQGNVTFAHASQLSLILGILGVVLALGLGLIITNSITSPLAVVVEALKRISQGDLLRNLDERTKDSVRCRGDEFGTLGKAMDQLTEQYMQPIGELAGRIADGDLTVRVVPKSKDDELGNALVLMVTRLRDVVGQISLSATQVASASEQLASASEQAGQATTQVTSTMQQVALGTSSQAGQATEAASAAEAMSQQVDGIAQGIARQAEAVTGANRSVVRLEETLGEANRAMDVGASTAQQAAQAARGGAETVQRAIQGMQAIQTSADVVAERVREMGQRSEEIGKIISTIQDIADQTNLLALNAAIEAARAGEQGRGFAVVADEVRKLAERSATASREIAELVKAVQKGTGDAVKATDDASTQVHAGVRDATEAGESLKQIRSAAEENSQATGAIQTASQKIQKISQELSQALALVAQVGHENVAATGNLRESIQEVSTAAGNVAAAAEENSASVEEVSATTEELSAQVEEVSASSQELASMGRDLQEAAGAFKLEEQPIGSARATGERSQQRKAGGAVKSNKANGSVRQALYTAK
jgi:methyl-accepting chemotaxis protein